jgi:hypothetical protein
MRSHLVQAVAWLLGPALGTLLIVAVTTASMNYQPIVTGAAVPEISAECTTSPDEMFNACAQLDTTEVVDTRAQYGEVTCPAGVTPGTPEGWARCDITEHPADAPDNTDLEVK